MPRVLPVLVSQMLSRPSSLPSKIKWPHAAMAVTVLSGWTPLAQKGLLGLASATCKQIPFFSWMSAWLSVSQMHCPMQESKSQGNFKFGLISNPAKGLHRENSAWNCGLIKLKSQSRILKELDFSKFWKKSYFASWDQQDSHSAIRQCKGKLLLRCICCRISPTASLWQCPLNSLVLDLMCLDSSHFSLVSTARPGGFAS